jgi:hypothetical protein
MKDTRKRKDQFILGFIWFGHYIKHEKSADLMQHLSQLLSDSQIIANRWMCQPVEQLKNREKKISTNCVESHMKDKIVTSSPAVLLSKILCLNFMHGVNALT